MLPEGIGQQLRILLGGDRLPGQHAEQADEQPMLVAGGAGQDRHLVEAAVPELLGRDLGQHLVAEPIGLERLRMGEQLLDRQVTQTRQGRGRIGAPSCTATAAPSASTSADARHPYQATAGSPGKMPPAGRSIKAKPLWTIARWNRPADPGATRWALVDNPP